MDKLLLSNKKVGKIQIGLSINDLYLNNTKIIDQQLEGFFSPAIEIFIEEDKPLIVAEIDKIEKIGMTFKFDLNPIPEKFYEKRNINLIQKIPLFLQ